jgi:hypothetical protein
MSEGPSSRVTPIKRLCVFHKDAAAYVGKRIEWIVCKQCQRGLRTGKLRNLIQR